MDNDLEKRLEQALGGIGISKVNINCSATSPNVQLYVWISDSVNYVNLLRFF